MMSVLLFLKSHLSQVSFAEVHVLSFERINGQFKLISL